MALMAPSDDPVKEVAWQWRQENPMKCVVSRIIKCNMNGASTPIVPMTTKKSKKKRSKDEERAQNSDRKNISKSRDGNMFSFFGDASSPSKSRSMTESRSISAVMSAIKS